MKRIWIPVLALALVLSSAPLAMAQEPVEPLTPPPTSTTEMMLDEFSPFWFVELSSPPAVEGTNMRTLTAEKNAFRTNAKRAGLVYTERYAYDTLFNGFSIAIEGSELGKLARIPGVANIYPVQTIDVPEPQEGPAPELFTSLAMVGADIAQSELGYTGEGIKVAVMDTGIDYDHPDLGGAFGPGCRVAYGWDFVGDAFNGENTPIPDPDPDDCHGHGTHVAGIIGANGDVVGVAPGVTFGAYRVFGCEGYTTDDIMLAAMEMALADDMDILNMSIGAAFEWPQSPTALASTRLVNKGMVVVASIGNNGDYGVYSAGAPGVGEKVIGVASFDNTYTYLPYFTVGGENFGYIAMEYAGPTPTSGTYEIVYVGEACDPLAVDLTGKVALISRGSCSFYNKAVNAINAGAVAVVIHNNVPGLFNGTLGEPIDGITPVVGISLEDGLFIQSQAAPIMMTWTDQLALFPSPTGGLISSFSSYGLSPDLAVKPDIGAPGGNIYSTYPLEKGGYATLGGTSQAAPHVAGAAALLLEARPKTPSQAVRGILQNSADPAFWSLAPGYLLLDHVHRQGAGMLDIDDAILSTTKIEPSKISAGEGEAGPFVQVLTIENKADTAVTYDMSYVNAVSTSGVMTIDGFWLCDDFVSFSTDSVTIPAHDTAELTATIFPASYPEYGQYGGYIVFTPQEGGQVYRVPYAGFVGDYQGIEVLTPTPYGFPALGWTPDGSSFGFAAPRQVFTMAGFDMPYLLVHFEHQPRTFHVTIYAEKGKCWHRTYSEKYLPRSSSPTSFYAFPFDGITSAGKKTYEVPDGTYYAVISVLKANGDKDNPAHWETWTSPLFEIDRP